jgi:basic amino acid/polyamine antiporter, APA family
MYLMYGLGMENWLRLFIWMALGLAVYFLYGRSHSRLGIDNAKANKAK